MAITVARTGYRDNEAYMVVEERSWDWAVASSYSTVEVAQFSLRYMPDSNEVVLVKTVAGEEGEAVYSELLSS